MNNLADYFAGRKAGFYIALGTAVLSLVLGIFYVIAYRHSVYLTYWGVFLPIAGALVMAAAAALGMFFDKKDLIYKAGVIAMWLLNFIGFVCFIYTTYLYFSEVFYAGFSFAALKEMRFAYAFCFLVYIIVIVLSNVCMYLKGGETINSEEAAV